MIDSVMKAIHAELLNIFERDWLPGIVFTATKLAQCNVLDWESFVELMAQGQRRAFQSGSLQRAANLLGTHETLRKSIQRISNRPKLSELDMLAQELRQELGADRLVKSAEPAQARAGTQPAAGATQAHESGSSG